MFHVFVKLFTTVSNCRQMMFDISIFQHNFPPEIFHLEVYCSFTWIIQQFGKNNRMHCFDGSNFSLNSTVQVQL